MTAKRSKITRDLHSPKYRQRIVPNRKKALAQRACRAKQAKITENQYGFNAAINNDT